MSIEIPTDLQSFISEQLRMGCFSSESQVVEEGLRLLKAERDECIEGIRRGLADAAAGRMEPLGDVFDDLRREFNVERLSR